VTTVGGPDAPESDLTRQRQKGVLAIVMAAIAGSVDAVGYLVLARLFTAHMSGNSVAFGAEVSQGRWGEVLRRGFPIPLFVLGVATGGVLIEAGSRRGIRRTMSLVLVLEAVLLVAFMLGESLTTRGGAVPTGHPPYFALAGTLTFAMGLQTAALQRVAGRTVRTTYVTGMLTRLAEESVVFAFWFRDERRARGHRRMRQWARAVQGQRPFNRAALLGAIWTGYITGAIAGGALHEGVHAWALAPAVGTIALVVAVDQRSPIHGARDVHAAIGA
jgi:uncharacterized membrane protein YoaK (UPF0700 family)